MTTRVANRLAIILVLILVLCTVVGLSSCEGDQSGDREMYRTEYSFGSCEGRIISIGMPAIVQYNRPDGRRYRFEYKDRHGDPRTGVVFQDSITITIKRIAIESDGYTIK
jgi:cytochrome c-type biogenesis protein CcmE